MTQIKYAFVKNTFSNMIKHFVFHVVMIWTTIGAIDERFRTIFGAIDALNF